MSKCKKYETLTSACELRRGAVRLGLKLLAGALAHGDLWSQPGEAVPGWRLRLSVGRRSRSAVAPAPRTWRACPRPEDRPPPVTDLVSRASSYPLRPGRD